MTTPTSAPRVDSYRNFDVAVYARVYEVQKMRDPAWLEPRWRVLSGHVAVDKIYLETHRDLLIADETTIETLKEYFEQRGVRTAGGITLTVNEANRFETFCYTNPDHRARVKAIAEHTARLFDEVILDDFVFTNCKCARCIETKGNRSWTAFRLELLHRAMRELIVEPSRALNDRIHLVIKFPNWYEHFAGLGYHLEAGAELFDGIYTGTETRQPTYNAQHMQPYLGYGLMRYFEQVAPKRNDGGWVDTGGMRDTDRYAEQLWLTLFAKAREITLFDFRQLQRPIRHNHRPQWHRPGSALDFDDLTAPYRQPDGSFSDCLTVARVAGQALRLADRFVGHLGAPVGVPSYRPYRARGEDFLHNYLGMIGVPVHLQPEFPATASTILLTEAAADDPEIVARLARHLRTGHRVVITSGLVRALQGRGLEQLAELSCGSAKIVADEFYVGHNPVVRSDSPISFAQLEYVTNDAWQLIGCHANSTPLLLEAGYGSGMLTVLVIPDNFADLYSLPSQVLDQVRSVVCDDQPVRLEGPSQICLFAYDNDTFIVESFRPEPVTVHLVVRKPCGNLRDLASGKHLDSAPPPETADGHVRYVVSIEPHSFRVLTANFPPSYGDSD